MKTNFHNKNFVLSLAFMMRFKATRKWSIIYVLNCFLSNCCKKTFFIPCKSTGFYLLEESFSPGDFKAFSNKATKPAAGTTAPVVEEELVVPNVPVDSDHEEGVYSCP